MNSLETLIAGLEDVEIGTGELDAEIEAAISEWRNLGGWWREHKVTGARERYNYRSPPHYTTSRDAALPGENIVDVHLLASGRWCAEQSSNDKVYTAIAHTEALARRIACLKARGD